MSVHIGAKPGDIAKTILLPGDPLRAKFIAENFLDNPVQFNNVRGMLGFTGTYKGIPISVMGTGMGVPSISIYVHELIHEYGVKNLMRVGSAGAIVPKVKIRDVVLASSASTTNGFNKNRFRGFDYAPTADFQLLSKAYESTKELGIEPIVGNVLSSDIFYDETNSHELFAKAGTLCVEMEAAGLYTAAAMADVRALTILTISDSLITGEATTSEERQKTFTDMMKIALETAVKINDLD
ncbi:MAG: purine-nucleoside phosphorylase [Clostridium sp.]|jgi:purine-nucleoside phosphorylase|nr:purine-nucleoside phosphorylase [Clostridium sp.]